MDCQVSTPYLHSNLKMRCILSQFLYPSLKRPAGKSRGRGIELFNDISKIFDYIGLPGFSGPGQWVVQKYIENPLTIAKRKFDIRQWVVVTDWNPLTIWFCEDCYVRFAVEEYEAKCSSGGSTTKTWDNDKYRHLVNNSVAKRSADFERTFVAENGTQIVGHMWPLKEFEEWLLHQKKHNIWEEDLLPKIKQIVIDSILCAQESIVPRKNTWELFGYDIMIDKDFKPWLIEINSSPACDYSTPVTELFVKASLPGILDIVFSSNDDRNNSLKSPNHISGWEKIYSAEYLQKTSHQIGSNIILNGHRVSNGKIQHKKVQSKKTRSLESKPKSEEVGSHQELEFNDSDLSDYVPEDQDETKNSKEDVMKREKSSKVKLLVKKQEYKENVVNKEIIPLRTLTLDINL